MVKIGKLDEMKHWTKWKIGQNGRNENLEKIKQNEQNWKLDKNCSLDKIENHAKLKIWIKWKNRAKLKIGQKSTKLKIRQKSTKLMKGQNWKIAHD